MDSNPRLPEHDRLPPIPEADRTAEQQRSVDLVVSGPRGMFGGPFHALLRSPVILDHMQLMGAYLRWDSQVDTRLKEFAMAVVTRRWEQPNEFATHAGFALKAGVSQQTINELAEQKTPTNAAADEIAVYNFIEELQTTHGVGDANYKPVLDLLGETGLMDLLGICVYYTGLSMVMNVARSPTPPGLVPYAPPQG